MAELVRFLARDGLLWRAKTSPMADQLCISKLWDKSAAAERCVHQRTIHLQGQKEWLAHLSEREQHKTQIISSIIWVACELIPPSENPTSAEILSELVQFLGLEAAYAVARTSFAGATEVPQENAVSANVQTYALTFHPKLAMVWRHDRTSHTTQAVCMAQPSLLSRLQDLFQTYAGIGDHCKAPVAICASLLSLQIDLSQAQLKHTVREVEQRTGYHQWTGRSEKHASGALSSLSARMSGCETRAASIERKMEVVQVLTEFALQDSFLASKQASNGQLTNSGDLDYGQHSRLGTPIAMLQERLRMQRIDIQFFSRRIQVQVHALTTLMTREETRSGIQLTAEAKAIAQATRDDSMAMKALAVMTIIFLPATTVATIFSMPTLNWEASASMAETGFKLYWAIAIPLTTVTVLAFVVWVTVARRRRNEGSSRPKG